MALRGDLELDQCPGVKRTYVTRASITELQERSKVQREAA